MCYYSSIQTRVYSEKPIGPTNKNNYNCQIDIQTKIQLQYQFIVVLSLYFTYKHVLCMPSCVTKTLTTCIVIMNPPVTLLLTLTVLVTTIDAQWEGMGDVGSARYEPALLPPCPTIRVLSCSN